MSIDNMKLRSKALIPLAVMALVVLGMVTFGAVKLSNISSTASEIIEKKDQAASLLIRSSRMVMTVPYAILGATVYDDQSPMGKAASESFTDAARMGPELMEKAAALAPDKAVQISAFKIRFLESVAQAKKAFELAKSGGGLDEADKLKPEELKRLIEVSHASADVDAGARHIVDDLVIFDNAFLAENAASAEVLRGQSSSALVTMSVVGLIATSIACAFSMWLTSTKIARPLNRLAERMAGLAQGEITTEIEGRERLDEVGAMAKAVEVFKQNALNLVASEAEQKRLTGLTEEERRQAEAKRTEAAREQTQVVQSLAQGLEHLSNGNLVFRLNDTFASDYEKLRLDFNGTMEKLQDTMKLVAVNTAAIRSGTSEISSASDDLSRRTEQQAASLEETAAALDEITATVRKTAEGSKHARDVVGQTKQAAEHSGQVVRQAVEAMSGIEASSDKIGNIIGVIDEIAFQTNLLALNAGVEAARAGDAGRGFAVVASEVRALAQRSADAAKEIKALILASSAQVDLGVNLVGQTGKSLELIGTQVNEINGIVADIAASAQEQATALDEVNTAINQMDQVTQQNAAMVEESTAASHALTKETEGLAQIIAGFDLGRGSAATEQTSRRAPRSASKSGAISRPVAALKTTGSGGAIRKPAPESGAWEEF